MNFEKRILELIELLSEYLQKTDRLLERMERHDALFERHDALFERHDGLFERHDALFEQHNALFEKQFARMDLAYQVIVTHSEKIESLQQQTQEIHEESRKESLKRDTQNQSLLNELISLSKRVQTIEGKN